MNATAFDKVYSIVAEYSDGTTKVLKEIKMAPGTDGVDTGIVNLEAGQSVRIYARNDSQAEPDGPGVVNPGTSNGVQKSGNETLMLIITIVGIVVFLGLVVVAVLVVLKKPAQKEEPEEEKEETAE